MTWNPDEPQMAEVKKCRFRLIPYCQGVGLDVGCGSEKIRPEAIGVDMDGKADLNLNLGLGLNIIADESLDYLFSSHCLEDFDDPERILKDWWRKIKVSGHLVLYLPHKDYYPNIGHAGCNVQHKQDFLPDDIIGMMDKFANYKILHQKICVEENEYSFEFVFKKLTNFKIPINFMNYNSQGINFDWRRV